MVEQSAVTWINQHPAGSVDKIGIAVVGSHGLPNEGVKITEYIHNFCFSPLNQGMDLARYGNLAILNYACILFFMSIRIKKADVKHKEHQFVHLMIISIDVRQKFSDFMDMSSL
jgi:hypothetical protein